MSDALEPALPRLFTAAEVARALHVTERYVRDKVRGCEWPCRRGPRGAPLFSAGYYAKILELMAVPVVESPPPRFSFAPKSRHRNT